jgi:hypothetical protein
MLRPTRVFFLINMYTDREEMSFLEDLVASLMFLLLIVTIVALAFWWYVRIYQQNLADISDRIDAQDDSLQKHSTQLQADLSDLDTRAMGNVQGARTELTAFQTSLADNIVSSSISSSNNISVGGDLSVKGNVCVGSRCVNQATFARLVDLTLSPPLSVSDIQRTVSGFSYSRVDSDSLFVKKADMKTVAGPQGPQGPPGIQGPPGASAALGGVLNGSLSITQNLNVDGTISGSGAEKLKRDLLTGDVRVGGRLCIGQTCLDESRLKTLMSSPGSSSAPPPPPPPQQQQQQQQSSAPPPPPLPQSSALPNSSYSLSIPSDLTMKGSESYQVQILPSTPPGSISWSVGEFAIPVFNGYIKINQSGVVTIIFGGGPVTATISATWSGGVIKKQVNIRGV